MKYRTLFSEAPYAASLMFENLRAQCSTCFASRTKKSFVDCMNGCDAVIYCDKSCRVADRSNHKYECEAFKNSNGAKIDGFVRLLGRILTRQMIDRGISHSSRHFPVHIPDRRLTDLMSHQTDIENNEYRSGEVKTTLDEFKQFFQNTPLVDDWNEVRRMYCVMWTNCFMITGRMNLENSHDPSPGYGFYLNASRFDHSCKPDLHVHFDGSLIVLQYPSSLEADEEIRKERLSKIESAQRFNNLTISYGFSHYFSNNCYFPLRRQRRASLEFGYFFRCQCVLCGDDREAILEEHAASIECDRCGEPCVWKRTHDSESSASVTCDKSCDCACTEKEMKKVKEYVENVDAASNLDTLERAWTNAMGVRLKDVRADDVVNVCTPALLLARKFWHPKANLRLCQLNERLFLSYNVIVHDAVERGANVDPSALQTGLETSESMIGWYQKHMANNFYSAVAMYARELARMYEIAATTAKTTSKDDAVKKLNRARHWFACAAWMWRSFGKRTGIFVRKLQSDAERVKRLATVTMSKEDTKDEKPVDD